jgi:hypothetical protein
MRCAGTYNVYYHRAGHISERATFVRDAPLYTQHQFSHPPNMSPPSKEARVILALAALQNNKNLSLREAAKIYDVSRTTLTQRRASKPARRDIPANSRNLTDLEEQTIVQYIIELDARSFPLRLSSVEDIVNYLLRERDAPPVDQL